MLSKVTRGDVQPSLDTCFQLVFFLLHLNLSSQAPKRACLVYLPLCRKEERVCQYILTFIFWKLLTCPQFFSNINQQYLWSFCWEPSTLPSHSSMPYLRLSITLFHSSLNLRQFVHSLLKIWIHKSWHTVVKCMRKISLGTGFPGRPRLLSFHIQKKRYWWMKPHAAGA